MAMDRPAPPVVPEGELLISAMDGHDRTRRMLERSGDDALTCDFLRWLRADRRPSVMTLDFCSRILPLVLACIRSKSVEIARGGLSGAQYMLKTFEVIILQTREVAS